MKLKPYEIWHKAINKFTSSGVILYARNKTQALELSGYKYKVRGIGGKIKEISVERIVEDKKFSYKIS
jgi:hypothetical protein